MEVLGNILDKIDSFVWGVPLIVLILAVGIYLSIRLGFLQIRHLPKALKFMFQNEEEGHGEVSSFGALCTALSATIGTGNIVGVQPPSAYWQVDREPCSGCGLQPCLVWQLSMQKDFWL